MTDLLSSDQVEQIRQAMTDIAETFAFPITILKITHVDGAFETAPTSVSYELSAIRNYTSASEVDQYRNALGPAEAHEMDLYIGWASLEEAELIDDENKPLLNHNDLVQMEGQIYEILAFAGVADMTKRPSFLQMRIKTRFQDPQGTEAI